MENIFIGICILFAVSSVSMAALFLLFKNKVNESPERIISEATITYDHIEEEMPKVKKRVKPNTNVKRKYKKKPTDEKGSVAR
mgnify:CR=1 FL=1